MKLSIIKELFEFLLRRKQYWIIPIVVILLGLAVIIILTESSIIAPFIYTLF